MSTEVKKKTKKIKNKRAANLRLLSIGSVIILLVIVIAANILFEKLIGNALTFDFSATRKNSISYVTEEVIDKIPEGSRVRIVGLFDRPTELEQTRYEYIVPLLDKYDSYGKDRLTVEYINPNTYPSIIEQLDPSGVYDLSNQGSVYVVKYDDKLSIVDPYDCFNYDQEAAMYGYDIPTENLSEFTFTNTINNQLAGFKKHAYFLTGLQEESSLPLKTILSSLRCDSQDLPVSDSFVVPEDCDILFINGINSDIPESVEIALKNYIANGGKLFVAVNYYYSNAQEKYDRLNSVLSDVNITIDNSLILDEEPGHKLNTQNYESYVDITDDFKSFAEKDKIHSAFARPVRSGDTPASYVTTLPILTTSDKAKAQDMTESGTQELEGKYNVGMYATYTGTDIFPEVYVFGTTNLTSDSYIQSYGVSDTNMEFFRSCIRNMFKLTPEETINIGSSGLDSHAIRTESVTSTTITVMALVFIAFIPLALIIVATVVYNRRKHL
ncbi:MAG: Gldg family protein [Clostridiales bacterium]|nr:Gldg family protein [Clostridiales bacterium]